MKQFERIWRYVLAEPFLWLFYYFVQPSNFHASVESNQASKRAVTMFRLALPVFIVSFFLLLLLSGTKINVWAAFLGLVGGIGLGTNTNVKWGISGCFGLGIGLGLGFDALFPVIAHPSALTVSSLSIGFGIGLGVGLGCYGDIIGASARRILGEIKGGVIGGGREFLKECLKWFGIGFLGGFGGLLIGFFIGVGVDGTPENITRGAIIGAILGSALGLIWVGRDIKKKRSGNILQDIVKVILFGLAFGIIGGGVGGITWEVMGGKAGILAFGAAWNLSKSASNPSGLFTGEGSLDGTLCIVIGFEVGVLLGITRTILERRRVASAIRADIDAGRQIGLHRGLEEGITLGIVWCILVSLACALAGGFDKSTLGNGNSFLAGIMLTLFYTIAYYRLPVYLVSSLFQYRANQASNKNHAGVFDYLDHSPLHWDESVGLPLPYLKETLLIASAQDINRMVGEVTFVVEWRPSQMNAVRQSLSETFMRELEKPKTLQGIADVSNQFAKFLRLIPSIFDRSWADWANRFVLINDASLEAKRYCDLDDEQIKEEALGRMLDHLRSITFEQFKSDASSQKAKLQNRLRDVVSKWQTIAQSQEPESGKVDLLDNPYTPNTTLKLGDTRFVGRKNLAKQLGQALRSKGSHPTFSLEGERRMGKSSLLEQLPKLLGSDYLSVYVNLQTTGVLSSAAAFLSTIAEKIYEAMQERGLQIKPLEESLLHQKTNRNNEEATYYLFEKWLKGVESALKRWDRELLLAFDEFEILGGEESTRNLNLHFLLNWLRSVTQNYSHIALLFSGVRNLNDLITKTGKNWGNYFVHIETLKVSFLLPQDAHQLIVKPVPHFPGEQVFSEEVVEAIIKETGCQPLLVHAVCDKLIVLLNNEKRRRAELRDIPRAVDEVFRSFDWYFEHLWFSTDQHQRDCLEALKELGEGDLYAIAQECGLDEGIVHYALQTLSTKRDIVLQENDIYRVAIPLFRTWIERKTVDPRS